MRYFILINFIIIIYACTKNTAVKYSLENNHTFNKVETIQLIKLLKKFDNHICNINEINNKQLPTCYNVFFKKLANQSEIGKIDLGIDSTLQYEFYNTLDSSLFSEIWLPGISVFRHRIPFTNKTVKDTLNSLYLNIEGKFISFLQNEVAVRNEKMRSIVSKISKIGEISPSVFADLIKSYSDYDIEDEGVRLYLVVFYLTYNQSSLNYQTSKISFENG